MFSNSTIEAIKSYVYALADGDEIFYIGKGQGNRIFDHVEDVKRLLKNDPGILSTESEESDNPNLMSPKRQRIAEILKRDNGAPPAMYIIRDGLTPEQALLLEATLISVLDWQLKGTLTNQVAGHGAAAFGLKTVQELEATRGEPFRLSELPNIDAGDWVIAINVNRRWPEVEAREKSLLEISRGWWRVAQGRANHCRYAVIHARGIVRGVFDIKEWERRCEDRRLAFIPLHEEPLPGPQFINKNAAPLFGEAGIGGQYPIRYIQLPK